MIRVKKRNGRLEELCLDKINRFVELACRDLSDVSASEVVLDAQVTFYDKIQTREITKGLIFSASSKIEKEPNYMYVAARLLMQDIYKEVFGESIDSDIFELQYRKSFITSIKKLVKVGRLDPKLLDFDLKRLSEALNLSNDKLFKYVGIQTLYDRYLIHIDGRRMESPQAFYMRVAMGLSINESDPTRAAVRFYEAISSFRYSPSTPTLFNAGTVRPQLSSCYLSTIHDSIDGIFGGIHNQARLSKYAGGLGVDWSYVRGSNGYIKGTNGKSNGVIPWLKVFNDTLVSVNQGGKRKGAGCAYLSDWHIDVFDFLELRKNTGDERLRCHDMHTAIWMSDEFFHRLEEGLDWYLFCPSECPDLHDSYGSAFEKRYSHYIELAKAGKIQNFKVMDSKELWKKILTMLFETGHPWITFKDPSNIRYSNKHEGVVHSSNLCTEILLHTKPTLYDEGTLVEIGETAVCNLASLNLENHFDSKNNDVDWKKLATTVKLAVRGLDNVIDINFYPTAEARKSNLRHRPVGLGVMGFHSLLHQLGINYNTEEAVNFSGKLQEYISYHAILASCSLAKERGNYESYSGSEWHKGKFPIDTYCDLMEERGEKVKREQFETIPDWKDLREAVSIYGMRNSNVMAVAPTATISYIQGCSQSIEPDFSVLWVTSNLSGEFAQINEYFVQKMKDKGLWCTELVDAIKRVDGNITLLNGAIPAEIKEEFITAFQMPYEVLVKCAAERQKWLDMGQSLNLYCDRPSLRYLSDMYLLAWKSGLKTTYYLRSKAVSKVEKSTVDVSDVSTENTGKVCSLDNPDCESCQ